MCKARRFCKTKHQVHVLHRLTRRTFDKIILHNKNDQLIAIIRAVYCDTQGVGAAYGTGFWDGSSRHNVNKGLGGIMLFEQFLEVGIQGVEEYAYIQG